MNPEKPFRIDEFGVELLEFGFAFWTAAAAAAAGLVGGLVGGLTVEPKSLI